MVSPHRTQRPWQGEVSKTAAPASLTYDPECYLCPGNKRAGGEVNPGYTGVFSFVNDYAAVLPNPPAVVDEILSPLLTSEPVQGICKVVCFHPAPQPHTGQNGAPRHPTPRHRRLGRGDRRDRLAGLDQANPGFRKPRRHDGRQQSPSPLPDLGHQPHPRRVCTRNRSAAGLSRRIRLLPALRLPSRRERIRRPRHRRK